MNEHPILFSGPMVRAILHRRKTQTRRVIKPQPTDEKRTNSYYRFDWKGRIWTHLSDPICPYGNPGDLLWVRETWMPNPGDEVAPDHDIHPYIYRADEAHYGPQIKWKSPIYMPRWVSRLTLRITNVRVERVQEMNFYDWVADFAPTFMQQERARQSFVGMQNMVEMATELWDSINAKRAPWESNPWVWVLTFEPVGQDE